MRSIAKLMGLALLVQDFSTLSRRGKSLKLAQKSRASDKPITLVVDSTGLKVYSEVGWNGYKHGAKGARKTWRKLHLALDPDSGDILASEETTEHVGDDVALPSLLDCVDAQVGRFLADGVYDSSCVSDCLAAAFGYEVDVVVPPPKNAVTISLPSPTAGSFEAVPLMRLRSAPQKSQHVRLPPQLRYRSMRLRF